jgi:hypothetical protein
MQLNDKGNKCTPVTGVGGGQSQKSTGELLAQDISSLSPITTITTTGAVSQRSRAKGSD